MGDILVELVELIFGVVGEACAPNVNDFKMADIWDVSTATGSFVQVMYDAIKIIGIGLTIVYFLLEINQKLALEGRDMTMKTFLAPFLKFMIAFAAIEQSGKIVGWIIGFGDSLLNTISHVITGGTSIFKLESWTQTMADIITLVSPAGFFAALLLCIVGLVALLVGTILKLVWWYKSILYRVELLARVSYLPIAVSDVYNGSHSNCIRYIKGFLVHVIWGASMIGLPNLVMSIAFANFEVAIEDGQVFSAIGAILSLLVVPFAAIAVTSTIKQVVKEAVG